MTPGPWSVGELDEQGQAIVRGEHFEICTCWHHSVGAIEKEMHANARLIAAAPDLLDALKDARIVLLWVVKTETGSFEAPATLAKVGAAIAKAEGK